MVKLHNQNVGEFKDEIRRKPTKQQKIKLVRVPIIKANSIVLDEAANLDQEIKMLTTIKSKKVIISSLIIIAIIAIQRSQSYEVSFNFHCDTCSVSYSGELSAKASCQA